MLSPLLHDLNVAEVQCPYQFPQKDCFLSVRLHQRQPYGRSKDLEYDPWKASPRAKVDHAIRRFGSQQVAGGEQRFAKMTPHNLIRLTDRREVNHSIPLQY